MHGYGDRSDRSDGVNDPLTFTAIVLEEGGRRALLGTADICTFPNDGSVPGLQQRLGEVIGCEAENIMLNVSHTHGGPMMPSSGWLFRELARTGGAEQYRDWMYDQVTEAAKEAVDTLAEGSLWFGEGKTAVPMNRRPDRDGHVPNAPNPEGGYDDRLQVLMIKDSEGEPAAIGVRVSCHPVATGSQHLITADFVGAWRSAFANAFGPGVVPFFLQGSGADARPSHVADGEKWRKMDHSELNLIGDQLMSETLTVLTSAEFKPVSELTLRGTIKTVTGPCEVRHTSRDHFEEVAKEGSIYATYAQEAIQKLDAGEEIPQSVDFTVHTLWLNSEFVMIGLNVEPLYALGAYVEAAAGAAQTMLLGYTNGCIGYAPDTVEMKRGGYEAMSYLYSVWSGPLLPGLEDVFAGGVAAYE
jgi:hypothetical protein